MRLIIKYLILLNLMQTPNDLASTLATLQAAGQLAPRSAILATPTSLEEWQAAEKAAQGQKAKKKREKKKMKEIEQKQQQREKQLALLNAKIASIEEKLTNDVPEKERKYLLAKLDVLHENHSSIMARRDITNDALSASGGASASGSGSASASGSGGASASGSGSASASGSGGGGGGGKH